VKLTFLGTGSAFTVDGNNFHSNLILEDESGKKLLIDCGSDARFSLFKQGYTYADITDVYISHLHADHAGGLEWLGFATHFDPSCEKPNLYLNHSLAHDLWHRSLAAGMSSIQGQVVDLDYYFNVTPVRENKPFKWCGHEFHLLQTIHVLNGFSLMPSFGLIFEIDGHTILITTDTQFCPSLMMEFYHHADLIFHDCEIKPTPTGVHAHFKELLQLEKSIKEKIWLYHYEPIKKPDAKKAGFRGFAMPGQSFILGDPKTWK